MAGVSTKGHRAQQSQQVVGDAAQQRDDQGAVWIGLDPRMLVFAYRSGKCVDGPTGSVDVLPAGQPPIMRRVLAAEGGELVVRSGIGTGYVTYAWSACAMLIVMHYFAGAPFKRLEALHLG